MAFNQNHCLICNTCQFEDPPVKESNLIDKQLYTLFILRNILEIPLEKIEAFLTRWGNPSEWMVKLCQECVDVVDNARRIYDEILNATRKYKAVRREIVQTVKRSSDVDDIPILLVNRITVESRNFVVTHDYDAFHDPDMSGDTMAAAALITTHVEEAIIVKTDDMEEVTQSSQANASQEEVIEESFSDADDEYEASATRDHADRLEEELVPEYIEGVRSGNFRLEEVDGQEMANADEDEVPGLENVSLASPVGNHDSVYGHSEDVGNVSPVPPPPEIPYDPTYRRDLIETRKLNYNQILLRRLLDNTCENVTLLAQSRLSPDHAIPYEDLYKQVRKDLEKLYLDSDLEKRRFLLFTHYRFMTEVEVEGSWNLLWCSLCRLDRSFPRDQPMREHFKECHAIVTIKYTCPGCQKTMSLPSEYRKHVDSCAPEGASTLAITSVPDYILDAYQDYIFCKDIGNRPLYLVKPGFPSLNRPTQSSHGSIKITRPIVKMNPETGCPFDPTIQIEPLNLPIQIKYTELRDWQELKPESVVKPNPGSIPIPSRKKNRLSSKPKVQHGSKPRRIGSTRTTNRCRSELREDCENCDDLESGNEVDDHNQDSDYEQPSRKRRV